MAENKMSSDAPHETGRDKNGDAEQSSTLSPVTVQLRVQASDDEERWLDYTCPNPVHGSLSEVVSKVRRVFFLDDSADIKICTSANAGFLDPDVPLSSILSGLNEGDHLVIHIEMAKKTGAEEDGEDSEFCAPVVAAEKIRQVVNEFAGDESAGEVKTSFTIRKKDRVIFVNNDQVFINQNLLHVLKEHVEHPRMIECIYLFLGATLGMISSILVAMMGGTLSPYAEGNFKTALMVASVMLFFLIILLIFIKSERKKMLRPIIEQLTAGQPQLPARGKEK
jgi:hypothetical protein